MMGNLLILKNTDFSVNNVGNSGLHSIDITVAYENKVISGFGTSSLSFDSPGISDSIWAKSSCISQEITIEGDIKYLYGIIPIIVPKSSVDTILANKTNTAVGDVAYYYLPFYNSSTEKWNNNNRINDIFEVFAVRRDMFANSNFAVILANFKLSEFTSDVHKFRVQWQKNAYESAGIGMEKPRLFYELA